MLANFGVEPPYFGLSILLHVRHLHEKCRHHAFLSLTLPIDDLRRMHVILTGQLCQS